MVEPVFAADGHSYEQSEIQKRFATGKRTSPMTNLAMPSTQLTPNRLLKSQIQAWRGQSSAQLISDLLGSVMVSTDPQVVEGNLLDLARFVGQNKAVVQAQTLQLLGCCKCPHISGSSPPSRD